MCAPHAMYAGTYPDDVMGILMLDQAKALVDTIPDVPLTYVAAEPVELPSEWPVERMRKRIRANQQALVERFPRLP